MRAAWLVVALLWVAPCTSAAQAPEPAHEVRAREVLREDRFDPAPNPLLDALAPGPRHQSAYRLERDAQAPSASGLAGPLRPSADGGFDYGEEGFEAHIHPDGRVDITPRPAFNFSKGVLPSFDITDFLLRRAGEEPYLRRHTVFLRETAALREGLSTAHARRTHPEVLARLRRRLVRLWEAPQQTTAQRRRALFELWDECNGTPVGALASQEVTEFVRLRLPWGHPDAFSNEELVSLNASRVRTEPFAPYAAQPEGPPQPTAPPRPTAPPQSPAPSPGAPARESSGGSSGSAPSRHP